MEGKTTDLDLVIELAKRNINHKYDKLIENAENGLYHDFKSEVATPKLLLVADLAEFPELADVSEAVKNGDYDE